MAIVGRPGQWTIERVVELFPLIGAPVEPRPPTCCPAASSRAVAIGRALMSNPELLLLDEVSLGLAPIVVTRPLQPRSPGLRAAGTTVVIVEQDVTLALEIADHVYCMLEGRVSLSGTPESLSHRGQSPTPTSECGLMVWINRSSSRACSSADCTRCSQPGCRWRSA